ncbi:Ig-like domain-containing protein [Clostridium cellulovorans]|uniref:Ig domain protein group 2 domain protein n=1 Tax=Clostridium cellulovorans (strain ATCC 35296 / DSM 3052 / OCM 3 / 743B) TaxID=573061 RepID=D9SMI5_CLOC7|nr:Ig-like domain-containing protein [Clostridium cellulovorans]ADL53841.1 Ig domain protein group 2 domain protein [Clostridium cellulovorans 743B]
MKKKCKMKGKYLALALSLSCIITPQLSYASEVDNTTMASNNGSFINLDWTKLSWDNLDWNELNYGIYWYGIGNKPYKFIPNETNPAFDPSKPTIIYIHGWQPNYSLIKHRESFYFYGENAADSWIKAGWNVGVFYWNQFSDELSVEDAESKIWSPTARNSMRWRKSDGSYDVSSSIKKSSADLLYEEYVKALSGYKGSSIRIVGHSLGSQMAIRLTKLISDNVDSGAIPPELLPSRVALLDPYFSNLGKEYLNYRWTGEVARECVSSFINNKNIPFELYKSSALTSGLAGDDNDELKKMCAYTELKPLFHAPIQQVEKHYDGKYTYFCSYRVSSPAEYVGTTPTGNVAASARTDTQRIAEMMGKKYYWTQAADIFTEDVSDDTFSRSTRNISVSPVTGLNLNTYNANVKVGEYISLIPTIAPDNATNKIVLWQSYDDKVAKVCVNGQVKGENPGMVKIICNTADGKLQKVCNVNVIE